MSKEINVMKKDTLPDRYIPSIEYDLFRDLMTNPNDENSAGNSLEYWDNIPRVRTH